MLSFVVLTAKIVLVLVMLLFCYYKLKKFSQFTQDHLYAVLAGVVVILLSFFLSSFLSPLTEEVTLTAVGTGESGPSGTDEVYLTGYTIDGKEYVAGESLEVVSGKWFWSGETYCWRLETDPRQPEGVTRSIVIKIPVGVERSLNFFSSKWRGEVEISTQNDTWVVDTYSDAESSTQLPVMIGRSSEALLLLNALLFIGAFAVVLSVLSGMTLGLFYFRYTNPEKWKVWIAANLGKVIYGCIAISTLAIMIKYAGKDSFWSDELLAIGIIKDGPATVIHEALIMRDATPPFYNLVGVLWMQIAPYGQQWLLLLSMVPCAIAIYVVGLIGEQLKGWFCGVIASIFMAMSSTVWISVAYELRSYAFLLLFGTLALYAYIQLNMSMSPKTLIFFSVMLVCLEMSHYFGMMACGLYFISDIYLLLKKKIKWTNFYSYLFPGAVGVFWLACVYSGTLSTRSPEEIANWYPVPGLGHVENLLTFLTGQSDLMYWLLILAVGWSIIICLSRKNVFKLKNGYFYLFSNACVIIIITIIFLYGNFINQKSTMWQGRYFLVLIPFVTVSAAVTMCHIMEHLCIKNIIKRSICLALYIGLTFNCVPYAATYSFNQPFREAADWIYTQVNYIFSDETLILLNGSEEAMRGFDQYYLTRNGRRDRLNVAVQLWGVETLAEYDRIYVVDLHNQLLSNIQQFLSENYNLVEDKQNVHVKVYERK